MLNQRRIQDFSKEAPSRKGEGSRPIIAGSLESANSSILAVHNLFKDFGGQKNQDFMLIRLNYPSNTIGCGGDMHG